MVFHPFQKDIRGLIPNMEIDSIETERILEFKNLGVITDESLSWKSHANVLSNKMSKYTGILNKLQSYLPLYVTKILQSAWWGQPYTMGC